MRGLIDEPFQQCRGLGAAGSAVGPGRSGVGGGHGDVEVDRREVVGAVRHAPRAGRQGGPDPGIGAAVADQPHPQTGERAIAPAAEFGVLHLTAAVGHRLHVLGAGRDPDHGPIEVFGRRRDDPVFVLHAGLATEAAADLGGDDMDVVGLPLQAGGDLAFDVVRELVRRPHGDPAVGRGRGSETVWLDRCDGDPLVDVAATHDHLRDRRQVERRIG